MARLAGTSVRIAVAGTMAQFLTSDPSPEALSEDVRADAEDLWDRLAGKSQKDRLTAVRSLREFQSPELCELLCARSEQEAEADPDLALELAELALEVAVRVPEDEASRSRLEGHVWEHLARALHEAGDLSGAEKALARARELREAGSPEDPDVPSGSGSPDLLAN